MSDEYVQTILSYVYGEDSKAMIEASKVERTKAARSRFIASVFLKAEYMRKHSRAALDWQALERAVSHVILNPSCMTARGGGAACARVTIRGCSEVAYVHVPHRCTMPQDWTFDRDILKCRSV